MDETFYLTNIAPQVGDGFNRHCAPLAASACLISQTGRGSRTLPADRPSRSTCVRRDRASPTAQDVYIFTVPLYLAKKDRDGKWRVSYEVIGPPSLAPSISVPTHFAKVILGTGGSEPGPAVGAFVLPNARIPDHTPLESFVTPGPSCPALSFAHVASRRGRDSQRPDAVQRRAQALGPAAVQPDATLRDRATIL